MHVKKTFFYLLLASVMLCTANAAVTIVPAPKELTDPLQSWNIAVSDSCAIVIGASASGPESYAAEQFQKWMSRRFGRTFDIKRENDALTGYTYVFLLGTRAGNALLDQLATANSVNLSATSPGFNGYVIEMVSSGGQNIALVGGSDASGVIYGQNTLFQLFEKTESGDLKLNHASIRDWPSVKSRGSFLPANKYGQKIMTPGYIDAYMMARYNTADIHWNSYGGAESEIDDAWVTQYVNEYKTKRGCFLWGSFNAKIDSVSEISTKIGYWNKYLNQYHVDGIWANLDDGGSSVNTYTLLDTFVKWGRVNGLADTNMMFLPKYPDYEHPLQPGNLDLVQAVPILREIPWIFTANPGPLAMNTADSILGLTYKPCWWNNLPADGWRGQNYYYYGFSYQAYVMDTVYYMDMLGPQDGWSCFWSPYTCTPAGYEQEPWISMENYTPRMLRWGGYRVPDEYLNMMMGLWTWNPADFNFKKLSMHIYKTIFGEEHAPSVAAFDSCLFLLKTVYFTPSATRPWPLQGNRAEAETIAQQMCQIVAELKDNPVTVLDSAWYRQKYIDGMEKVVKVLHDYLGHTYAACEPAAQIESTRMQIQPMQVSVFPNPFNPAVSITYALGNKDKKAAMEIFDLSGRLIRSFALRDGHSTVVWQGEGRQGRTAASGIYIFRLKSGDKILEKTAVLLK